MSNILTGTPLDRIINACDPLNMRGDCAMAVALGVATHLAGQSLVYRHGRPTAVHEYLIIGPPGAGKSHFVRLIKELYRSLDIPVIHTAPKSFEAISDLLHKAMQRRLENAPDGTPQFETVSKHAVVIVDEQGALLQAQGHGDAAAMASAGVQIAINMTADGLVGDSYAVTRKSEYPEIEGSTVTWYRLAQLDNAGTMIAATRAGGPGAERRQAPFFIQKDPPRDENGNLFPEGSKEARLAAGAILDRSLDIAQVIAAVSEFFGARIAAALRADLEGAVRQKIEIQDPEDRAIYPAIEAAAHGDENWKQYGGDDAFMIATQLAGAFACARGAAVTNDDDWRHAAAWVEKVHSNGETALELQDSATDQLAALREVQQRFARAPYSGTADEPQTVHRLGKTTEWVGRKQLRLWALCVWGLANLMLGRGLVKGRRGPCFYRRREPVEAPVDIPRDVTMMDFLAMLRNIQRAHNEDISAFPPKLPPLDEDVSASPQQLPPSA